MFSVFHKLTTIGLVISLGLASPVSAKESLLSNCLSGIGRLTKKVATRISASEKPYLTAAEQRGQGSSFYERWRNTTMPWVLGTLAAYAPTILFRENGIHTWFTEHDSNFFHGITFALGTELAAHALNKTANHYPRLTRLGVAAGLAAGTVMTEVVLTHDMGDLAMGMIAVPAYLGLSNWLYRRADAHTHKRLLSKKNSPQE